LNYLSVCSGIEAASVAWNPLGWEAVAFSEIEKFPCQVLQHHYPQVPNFGDMTNFKEWPDANVDILIGGTPCQSFSIAGLRKGLDDPRGNLMLIYLAIAAKYRPKWLVWENVPGVLSSNGGRDFGAFLGGLGECGYGFAYRVLDAQYFGVPQRRRRVFVVGCLRDWRSAAAVLFERHSLQGNPAPRRETGKDLAAGTVRSTQGGSDVDHARAGHLQAFGGNDTRGPIDVATARNACASASGRMDFESETFLVSHALCGEGFDASEDGTGRGTPLVPVAWSLMPQNSGKDFKARSVDVLQPLMAGGPQHGNQGGDIIQQAMQVRRLTPRECERLQGFPDDYTKLSDKTSDGPRYKALGNSMAVPVILWLGERIQAVDEIHKMQAVA
jgi:DNA (cytosine-5)-methyltransferase 1